MPKRQLQQKHKQDKNQQDVELNQFVRHPPAPLPHYSLLRSRSPSPSSPSGSTLDLPNVPFYPRLPPIVSPPSKQINFRFFAENDSDCSPIRPAGESVLARINCPPRWLSLNTELCCGVSELRWPSSLFVSCVWSFVRLCLCLLTSLKKDEMLCKVWVHEAWIHFLLSVEEGSFELQQHK